jgi:copper transport protein
VTLSAASVLLSSAPLSSPDLWLTGIERAVLLAGLSVALGGLAGRAIARHYKGPRPGPLPTPWALRGALLGMAASAALLITAVVGRGLAARLAQPPAPGLRANATAVVAVVELACFALAALLLKVHRAQPAALFLSGVVLAEGIRAHPEGIIPVAGALLTYCHLLPAVLWAGLLFYMLRAAVSWRASSAAVQGLFKLYAGLAAWLFGAVILTGILSVLLLVPLSKLFTTAYGLFLVAKAVVVLVAAAMAVAGRMWLRNRPAAGAGPALVTRIELSALAIALAVTGVLTVLTPPARPLDSRSAAAVSLYSGAQHR